MLHSMLHSLRLFCFLLITTLTAHAQVSIGSLTPAPGAQLDVVATDKGILIPRVTSTASVTATSEGLLVYQTTEPAGFYVRKAGSWVRLATTEDTPGTIILFASGPRLNMPAGKVALLGFGNSIDDVNPTDLSRPRPGSTLDYFAGLLPRAGTLTSISASFFPRAMELDGIVIKAQLYTDSGTDDSFSPIPGAEVLLIAPPYSSTGVRGMTANLNIPLAAQSRLLMVLSAENDSVYGYASAGITIK